MAGNLKAQWRMKFIAILRYLDSNHEECVLKEVFTVQFAFADGFLTFSTNLRFVLMTSSLLFGRKKEKDMTNFKTHFKKNVCSDPTSAIKIFYIIWGSKCH